MLIYPKLPILFAYSKTLFKAPIFVIMQAKKELRKAMLRQRNSQSTELKSRYDERICSTLKQYIQQHQYRSVHAYIPMAGEIDIRPLLQWMLDMKIEVVCPKTLPKRQLENRLLTSLDNLETGIMQTQHPREAIVYNGPIDLVIVPGLAFDSNNFRLGYGGGYYDHFLTQVSKADHVGIFYPFQEVDEVPREDHDIQLKQILRLD